MKTRIAFVVLSLFEATRGYTQKMTGVVVAPLSQLMTRLATALPLLVVAALAAVSVFVLVRFVGLFFASVARGETPLGWLPADLAAPTSVLLRSGIVIAALVFLAPIVTGDADGVVTRVGIIAIGSSFGKIHDSKFTRTLADSIHLTGSSNNIEVYRNRVEQSGDDGVA